MTIDLLGGRYRVLEELGRGGFGVVHRATDVATGGDVAIKFLQRVDAGELQRFRREPRILQSIAGPHVVAVLDADFDVPQPYFVMEFCAKGSIDSWANPKRTARDVAILLRHAALGLARLHELGGFHRDVKPTNILLATNADGGIVAKVADFGIARTPAPGTGAMTWSPMGTPGYVAPEVMMGQPVSAASDVYSLGITLREVLTGSREVLSQRALNVPLELNLLIMQMTSGAPLSRPSMAVVAAELERFIRGSGLSVVAPLPPAPTPSPPAVPGLAAAAPAAGGALAAAGLLGLAWWLFGGDDARWDSSVGRYRGSDGRFA